MICYAIKYYLIKKLSMYFIFEMLGFSLSVHKELFSSKGDKHSLKMATTIEPS